MHSNESSLEEFVELLVEIAALQRLRVHWDEASEKDGTWYAKNEVLESLLERKLKEREEALEAFKEEYPDLEDFSFGYFSTYDA